MFLSWAYRASLHSTGLCPGFVFYLAQMLLSGNVDEIRDLCSKTSVAFVSLPMYKTRNIPCFFFVCRHSLSQRFFRSHSGNYRCEPTNESEPMCSACVEFKTLQWRVLQRGSSALHDPNHHSWTTGRCSHWRFARCRLVAFFSNA